MLRDRLISAAVGIIVLFAVLLSETIFLNIAISVLIIVAVCEIYSAMGYFKKKPLGILGLFVPVLMIYGRFYQQKFFENFSYMPILVYSYILILFVILIINHKTIKIADILTMFSLTFIITFCFFYIVITRQLPYGQYFVLAILVGSFCTDTFAYFVGMALGKHKLCPEISPKKTVEGAIGGVIGSTLSMALFGFIVGKIPNALVPNYTNLLILGLICGIVAQIGDLSMSAIKREANIKDFGNIMPGHGGVLDRFDSVIFVAPLVYAFISILPIFERIV